MFMLAAQRLANTLKVTHFIFGFLVFN